MALGIWDTFTCEDGVEKVCEHHNTKEDLIGNFDDYVSDKESFSAIRFRWLFAYFIEIALSDKLMENLLHETRKDGRYHKNSEYSVLKSLLTWIDVEEGETDEES